MGLLSRMTSIAALLLMTSLFAMHQIQAWKVKEISRPTFECSKPDPRYSDAFANASFKIVDASAKKINISFAATVLTNVSKEIKVSLSGFVHLVDWGLDFDIPSQHVNLCDVDGMCPLSEGFFNRTFAMDKFEGFWAGIYHIRLTALAKKYRSCINVNVTVAKTK